MLNHNFNIDGRHLNIACNLSHKNIETKAIVIIIQVIGENHIM